MCRASDVATESMVAYTNLTSDVSQQIGREAEMDGCVNFAPLLFRMKAGLTNTAQTQTLSIPHKTIKWPQLKLMEV